MRKSKAKKRVWLPDPIFNDVMVTRFLNNLMYDGKKNTASKIFHEAIGIVAKRTSEDGLEVWKKAIANVTPQVEVRSRRVGGATFQIPSEIRPGTAVARTVARAGVPCALRCVPSPVVKPRTSNGSTMGKERRFGE